MVFTKDWYKTHENPKAMLGRKHSKETIAKLIAAHTGTKVNAEGRKNISNGKLGDKNPNWKGNNVALTGLHQWIKRHKPKVELCEICKISKPHDLANISQEYKRDINDYEWLCRRCHMIKDGRLEQFKKNSYWRKK